MARIASCQTGKFIHYDPYEQWAAINESWRLFGVFEDMFKNFYDEKQKKKGIVGGI